MELIWPEHGETKADFIKRVADSPDFMKAFKAKKSSIEAAETLWWQVGLALSGNGEGVKELTLRHHSEQPDWLQLSGIKNIDDVPRQRFEKELIYAGEFYKDSEDLDFTVTGAHLDNWEHQFSRMKANGCSVRICAGHDGADDPDKTRGEVLSIFRKNDSLVMHCEMVGEDAILAASRNDVSIFAPVSWTDDKKNEYIQPITHVAVVPDQVISDLNVWVPIAASRKGNKMSMDFKAWGKTLGLGADVEFNEDNALSHVTKLVKGLRKERDDLKKPTKASKGKPEEDGDPDNNGKENKPFIPKTVVNSVVLGRESRLKNLVLHGNITPAVEKKLSSQYCEPGALKLSMQADEDDGFDSLIETLGENDPVKLGEQTKAQTAKQLSSGRKDDDAKDTPLALAKEAAKKRNEK